MASLSLRRVGAIQHAQVLAQSSPLCVTYVELMAGAYLFASVNAARNQCIVEALVDTAAAAVSAVTSMNARSASSAVTWVAEHEKFLETLQSDFRIPKIFEVMQHEGVITTIELARDYRTVEGSRVMVTGRKRMLESIYVHLFIGTSNGTIFVCNALRGTIMALTQFQYHGFAESHQFNTPEEDGTGLTSRNEAVVRFVVQRAAPDAHFNANITQGIALLPTQTLHAVCIIHSRGRAVLLNRAALDTFLSVAEQCLDGKRPYLFLEWSPESTVSSYPTAGPAAHFISYVESVFVASEEGRYSAVELQTQPKKSNGPMGRTIRDAALFFGNLCDTTAILRNGPQAMMFLLLCGETPALSMYTFENARAAFSARQAVRAAASFLGSMTRRLWHGSRKDEGSVTSKPKRLAKHPQQAKDAFYEADMVFSSVQVDPTSHWAACYSESAGRIYLYDLMGGTIWRVMKGCRSAQCQWCMATIAGKRMLLLVVHLLLRHAVELYSLRLGQRLAARHVPQGSIMLRPESVSSALSILLLTPSREIVQIHVELKVKQEEEVSSLFCLAAPSASGGEGVTSTSKLQEKLYQVMPRDVLIAAMQLPLPVPATDASLFSVYHAYMKELEATVKNRFSPGVSDDRCLPMNFEVTAENVPHDISAAQCLNYLELRLACVTNYRRALMLRGLDGEVRQKDITTSQVLCNDVFFTEEGQPHRSLVQAVRTVSDLLCAAGAAEIVHLLDDILPAMQRLLQTHKDPTPECTSLHISAMSPDAFLKLFYCGGYKLEFLRDIVWGSEDARDAVEDIWAEIGAVFYSSSGGGLGSLMQQLEVFSTLGFQTTEVAVISLSWFCCSFARLPTSASLGLLSNLVSLLQTCNDAAFLTAVEHVPCLTTGVTSTNLEECEACVLLLTLCMVIRQQARPVGQIYYGRYVHLLRQLLALRVMLHHSETQLHSFTTAASRKEHQRLRLRGLLPCDGGDALNAYCFRFFPASVARVLCKNIMGSDELTRVLGGVDMLELLNPIFIRVETPEWNVETPWYKERTWNHGVFSEYVLKPLSSAAAAVMPTGSEEQSWIGTPTPQQVGGLGVILAVELILLEWVLEPLREEPLAFFQNNLVPDANLFEGNEELVKEPARRPKGSRSTRDYFNSCRKLLALTRDCVVAIVGEAKDTESCGKFVEAMSVLLSYDNKAFFALIPRVIRRQLEALMALLQVSPASFLRRIDDVSSFLDTVMFFAFTEAATQLSCVTSPCFGSLAIPWSCMFEVKGRLLRLSPEADITEPVKRQQTVSRMQMRSSLLREFAFMSFEGTRNDATDGRVVQLGAALGLTCIVSDIPQLVLFDAAALHLASNSELTRLLNAVASRHLAARIAAEAFRIIVANCFRYYVVLKRGISKEDRPELQQLSLKIKSMRATMTEECRLWLLSKTAKEESDTGKEAEPMSSLPLEHELVACPSWYTPHLLSVVEGRVQGRLRQPRGSEGFSDLKALLFTLALAAAGAKSALEGAAPHVAEELPVVATRLAGLL
ncbi:hypothetical protein TraAM80_02859 [Trypanosoma rangeli]|uniref:Rab3-GAP regulatory subunit N-terminal domain-containing protein n=1 Tax=Trypanosoma rangeli TaxID=5698 RepID=A0A422NSF3_TRYRA|nr:uncharacterized protein TraAM80_02859 [Trypanosoma rangeli]RNF08398.1 hypothetical protein TraAM80_02859 [Trypanosoma rangeli]|eukprot:RNF08398.1 hypothetical protein TraAM80_02859 [Trypanosoma rangeli]